MKNLEINLKEIDIIRECLLAKLDFLQDELYDNEYLLLNEKDNLKCLTYKTLYKYYREETEVVLSLLKKLEKTDE
jgi:hypothetical protein